MRIIIERRSVHGDNGYYGKVSADIINGVLFGGEPVFPDARAHTEAAQPMAALSLKRIGSTSSLSGRISYSGKLSSSSSRIAPV